MAHIKNVQEERGVMEKSTYTECIMHPSTNSPYGGMGGLAAFLGGDMKSPHVGIALFYAI